MQHLHDLGFLGPEVTCGHSVWATEEDLGLMAATGANICHNASSNLRLQSGIAPMGRILAAGIKVAIGSDEAGLNDDKDLFQEMRLVLKLHRVPGMDLEPPTSCQVLEMATVNGAYASWFGDRIGTLEPGKRADLVLLDLRNIEEPYLDPEVPLVEALVHRGRGVDVDTVLVDGEVVLRDGQLTRVDKEALFREIKEVLDRPLPAWRWSGGSWPGWWSPICAGSTRAPWQRTRLPSRCTTPAPEGQPTGARRMLDSGMSLRFVAGEMEVSRDAPRRALKVVGGAGA